jgi:hypothetical protein
MGKEKAISCIFSSQVLWQSSNYQYLPNFAGQYKFEPMRSNILLALYLLATSLSAQKIKVDESSQKVGGASRNALTAIVYQADPATIIKEWKGLMKGYGGKSTVTENEVFTDNAVILSFGNNNTVDIYARVEKINDKETKLIAAFDLNGAFLNSTQHPIQAKEARQMIYDFAFKQSKAAVNAQLKDAQKALTKLSDQQKKIEKDNETLKMDIEKLKEKIKRNEETLQTNGTALDAKKKETDAQQKVVDAKLIEIRAYD